MQVHAAEHMLTSGRIDHASAIADALLTEAPDDADALCLKGRCLMAAGDRAAVRNRTIGNAVHCNILLTTKHHRRTQALHLRCTPTRPTRAPTWHVPSCWPQGVTTSKHCAACKLHGTLHQATHPCRPHWALP